MPHQVPEFPLLQDFTRVTPQAHAHPMHELYVFHRYTLSHDLVVRPLIVSRGTREEVAVALSYFIILRGVGHCCPIIALPLFLFLPCGLIYPRVCLL